MPGIFIPKILRLISDFSRLHHLSIRNVMLTKKNFITLLLVLFTLAACKKQAVPVDLSDTTFKGTAIIGSRTYDPFSVTFHPDGSATFRFHTDSFAGNWSKTPNSSIVYVIFDEPFNATTTLKWKGQATLNASNNKLEGGIMNRIPYPATGTFTAVKQ